MLLFDILSDIVFDYTLRSVAIGSAVLGIVSGVLGCYALLRRQALLGDAISHTALPGVALAFLITGSRLPLWLMLGAAAAGWIGTLAVMTIVRRSRVKQDSALGMILAVFFGLLFATFLISATGSGTVGERCLVYSYFGIALGYLYRLREPVPATKKNDYFPV